MYTVEIYGRVRRAVLAEGKSERTVTRELGIARDTHDVAVFRAAGLPAGTTSKAAQAGPWIGVIDTILERLWLDGAIEEGLPRERKEK
jgi:hypothetical protein